MALSHFHRPQAIDFCFTIDPWMARQCRQLSYIVEFTVLVIFCMSRMWITLWPTPCPGASEEWPTGKAAGVNVPSGSPATRALVSLVSSASILPAGIDYKEVATGQQYCSATKEALTTSNLCIQMVLLGGVSSDVMSRPARCGLL